jgi:hypothetical protein
MSKDPLAVPSFFESSLLESADGNDHTGPVGVKTHRAGGNYDDGRATGL